MTEKPAPPATKKLLGLEALRFAAAFGVLIYHYQHFAYLADQPADVLTSNLPLYGMLHLFY